MDNGNLATAHRAWDRRWRDEAGRAEWLEPEPEVLAVVAELARRRVRTVLDLGAGVGRHALYLARLGFQVSAQDGSPAGVAFLREAAEREGLRLDCAVSDMTSLPFPAGRFDFVLSWNVIYHGDEAIVRRAIGEILRVMRPGGLYLGTMLSKRHDYFRRGREVAPDTWLDEGESEADKDHPHFYCDARKTLELFRAFEPLALVDREHKAPGSWHWHLLAERRS